MKRVLVLSGGGARGSIQIGCINELYLKGVRWDAVVGVSAGALNAAGIAHFGPTKSIDFWKSVKSNSDILDRNWISFLWKQGMYNLKPLEKLLRKTFKDAPTPWLDFYMGITNLRNGILRFEKGKSETLIEHLLASSCIPAIMEPSGQEADGGVRDTVPLSFAIRDLGADEIDVVMCQALDRNQWFLEEKWKPSFPKILSTAARAVEILSAEVTYGDIQMCVTRNSDPAFKRIKLNVYSPIKKPPIDTLEFDREKIALGLEYGKQMASQPTLGVE